MTTNYSEVRPTDLEHVIISYISSWNTVIVAGLAFKNKKMWYPGAFFAWTDPASLGRREECQVIGHPDLPENVRLFKEWCYPPRSLYILTEILKGGTVEFTKTPVTFANFRFARSAFLSSAGFDHIYCKDIQPFTEGKPKLFVVVSFRGLAERAHVKFRKFAYKDTGAGNGLDRALRAAFGDAPGVNKALRLRSAESGSELNQTLSDAIGWGLGSVFEDRCSVS